MRSIHFGVQEFNRIYWDLFVAAGFSRNCGLERMRDAGGVTRRMLLAAR
jgi:hypothetical protein